MEAMNSNEFDLSDLEGKSTQYELPKRELYELESELLSSLTPATPATAYSPCSTTSPDSSRSQESPEPTAEKKPVKKRKSWGQELPTPTTNLPPRKRAKTEAEKEQRRIERVLRNRAAAQSSRERKRKEVEALEDVKNNLADTNTTLQQDNVNLHKRLDAVLAQNQALMVELQKLKAQLDNNNNMSFKTEYDSSPLLHPILTPVSVTHDSFSSMSPSDHSPPSQ
jgi:transcriptional activator HAC1